MGPKKKGKKPAVMIDGINTSELSREQLEALALRIKEELEREREERNFFQLERDKLRTFYEITRTDLEEANARLRNKDRQIEVSTDVNEDKIKEIREKVKHLQYEHNATIAELRTENMLSLQAAQEDYMAQEEELLHDKKQLKATLFEGEQDHDDEVRSLKLKQAEEINEKIKKFDEMSKAIEAKFGKMYEKFRNDTHTKHLSEMVEADKITKIQIRSLIEDHAKALLEIKNYYNNRTENNLQVISDLKDHTKELCDKIDKLSKKVKDVTTENIKLCDPLAKALSEAKELRRKLRNCESSQMSLDNTLKKLNTKEQELAQLRWAFEALQLRFEKELAAADNKALGVYEEKFVKYLKQQRLKVKKRVTFADLVDDLTKSHPWNRSIIL